LAELWLTGPYRDISMLQTMPFKTDLIDQNFDSWFRRWGILLVLLLTFSFTNTAQANLQAERIANANAVNLIMKGPDAIGGIGDWFISNGVLCAVFSDVSHEGEFSSRGGILVDLGFCGQSDDHYTYAQDLLDGDRYKPLDVQTIQAELIDGEAVVTTVAENEGVIVTTRYSLSEAKPTQIAIKKSIALAEKDSTSFNFYSPFWFNYHSLETYIYSSKDPEQSRGFSNIEFVSRGTSAITQATHNADTIILPSPPDAETPISYGWQLRSARRLDGGDVTELPVFALADKVSTTFLVLADSFYIGDGSNVGWFQLPQIPLLSLDFGDTIELEEIIYVGASADVASITDQILADTRSSGVVQILGKVNAPNSALHIETNSGSPITFVRPDATGSFSFMAEAGEYQIRHVDGSGQSQLHDLVIRGENIDLGELDLAKPAQIALPRGKAMRLVFEGLGASANPDFDSRLTEYSVADAEGVHYRDKVTQIFLAGVDSDPATVEIATGSYRVYATRGPEYSLSTVELSVAAGKTAPLIIDVPQQVVKTPGFIASDLHVHSGLSFDNTFSTSQRVRTFVAEHGEIMVSSEHDVPVDFTPFIKMLGVQEKISSIAAIEATSILPSDTNPYTGGHVNFFPTMPKPLAYRRGGVRNEDRRLRDVLHEMSTNHPEVISQLNHARQNLSLSGDENGEMPDNYRELIDNGGFLDHMGVAGYPYNPNKSLDTFPNNTLTEMDPITGWRDIDMDAMEIINPGGIYHDERIMALRKDWMSFLKQGLTITGTANSDSHHANQQVAVPRTMVAVVGDSIKTFNQSEFLTALREGNAYGTTGPMLQLDLSGARMGETYLSNSGVLSITVSSADWIPLTSVRVQLNGETIAELDASQKREFEVLINAQKDSFLTVEAFGRVSAGYAAVYPGLSPYAFSNPIYIDADGDGVWTAPGL
jgi:hypothetical protein